MFIAVVLLLVKNCTEFKCLSADEWLSTFQCICTIGMLLGNEKERAVDRQQCAWISE